jgi:hypothetical protein
MPFQRRREGVQPMNGLDEIPDILRGLHVFNTEWDDGDLPVNRSFHLSHDLR